MSDTADRPTRAQIHVVLAAFLGWTLDAFDFFIMAFVLREVAATFGAPIGSVALAITLTLACRAIGAVLFGRLADRYGRRPTLMVNVLCYSLLEFCSGLAPTLAVFLILRALYGVAMGGEWGVGASLTMESVPAKWRGTVSGLLQAGYPCGYMLASVLYLALPWLGWRGMFMAGVVPALLVFYIRRTVPESPDWLARTQQQRKVGIWTVLRQHAGLVVFAAIVMMAFNFFSHGSQDLYPSQFLGAQHHLAADRISLITIVGNVGAILGGIGFGTLSQRIGRKWAIVIAALLALPALRVWAFSTTPAMLGLGAFVMQVCVQGAWGVVPVYLNELSPASIRGTFPGLVYQLGNFLAAANANIQIWLAERFDGNYGMALAIVVGIVAVVIAVSVALGREPKGTRMGSDSV
ncbi:MFS transporter [Acidisphaera sp. S103]|uniref:MFS transporter n=1 Tax=Acidisphaera sp. S103 TaxID=1747223 RepID=UPI00131ADC45|nr:MFS transporter [Acidisphaera sp. S103]